MSAAGHDHSFPALGVPDARPRIADIAIALLGTALSIAAIWFILVPSIREAPATLQTCEVVVLTDGTVRCDNGKLTNVLDRQP